MERRRAFTLIELMVVMVIITLLASMLFPSVRKAREQSQRVACMSNLRQVTQAFITYAADHDGQFLCLDSTIAQIGIAGNTDDGQVILALYPYLQNSHVFHCPADPRDNGLSYSPNDFLGPRYRVWADYINPLPQYTKVLNSASVYAMIEEFDLHPRTPDKPGGFVIEAAPATIWIDTPGVAHGGGSCLTFLDGHCEFWPWSDARTLAFPAGSHKVTTPNNLDLARLQAVLGGK